MVSKSTHSSISSTRLLHANDPLSHYYLHFFTNHGFTIPMFHEVKPLFKNKLDCTKI